MEPDDVPAVGYDSRGRVIELRGCPGAWYELGGGRVVAVPTTRVEPEALRAALDDVREAYREAGFEAPDAALPMREQLLAWARILGFSWS